MHLNAVGKTCSSVIYACVEDCALAEAQGLAEASSRVNDAGAQQATVEDQDLVLGRAARIATVAEEHQPFARPECI